MVNKLKERGGGTWHHYPSICILQRHIFFHVYSLKRKKNHFGLKPDDSILSRLKNKTGLSLPVFALFLLVLRSARRQRRVL